MTRTDRGRPAAGPSDDQPGRQWSRRGLWGRWVLANAVGELVGLGTVAGVALLLVATTGADATFGEGPAFLAAVVALGAVEGAVVGAAQWLVLRRAWPTIRARAWVGATAAGALVAWLLGMVPSTLLGGPADGAAAAEPSGPVLLALAAGLGVVLGPVLAAFQWVVLRRHVAGAAWWLPANAAAWAVGMPLVFLGVGSAVEGGTGAASLVRLAMAIVAAGAAVGAVHGVAVVRLRKAAELAVGRPSRPGEDREI